MSRLKFATENLIWTEEQWDCIYFSGESKFNLFGCDGRRFVRHSLKKLYSPQCAKNLGEKVWWCLTWFLLLVQDLLSSYTVKSMQQYIKRYWRNMLYLIWELQLINQLYLCKITLRVIQRSLLWHFFLSRMLLLWSGLPKTQTGILLRMFGSY